MIEFTGADVPAICGSFYDAVISGRVTVRTDPDLDGSVAAAKRRSVGEAWAWGRKLGGDISLLMAATVALAASDRHQPMAGPDVVRL